MKLILAFFITFLSFGAFSQPENLTQKIDKILTKEYKTLETGGTILIAKDGEIMYQKAFGFSNLEFGVPTEIDHVFQIASMTKQFTAISIIMLMEEGKLNLNDPVSKYLEGFPDGDQITIHHLLTHTSGISRNITLKPWDRLIRKKNFTPLEFIDYFKEEPKAAEPGEAYQYNNFGYIMLGAIIEKVAKMSYEQFLQKNIFDPLNMHNSYVKKDHQFVKNMVNGYTKDYGTLSQKGYYSPSLAFAAGNIMSTVEDLFKWNEGLQNNILISKESKQMAFTNHTLNNGSSINYGYGWFINEMQGFNTIEHAGGMPGFGSNGIFLPEEDIYVVLLNNCDNTYPKYVSTKMAALVAGNPFTEPKDDFKTDLNELQKWVGQYTFGNGSKRSIYLNKEDLYYILPNGTEFKLLALSHSSFLIDNTFTQVDFNMIGDSLVHLNTKNGNKKKLGVKKYQKHEEINLPTKEMKKFIGEYQLFPKFSITISLVNGQLQSTGTGQEALDIFPESPTRFFFKSIDSYIDFNVDDKGNCTAFELIQDGKSYVGKKKQ